MRVEGQNNRVAMRDYYEKPTLYLTPEQLKELSVKPCARCEARLVVAGASICRRCRETLRDGTRKERLRRYVAAILFSWGMLIQMQGKTVVMDMYRLLELGVGAAAMVLTGSRVLAAFKDWWRFNGDDLLKFTGNAVKKRIGRH